MDIFLKQIFFIIFTIFYTLSSPVLASDHIALKAGVHWEPQSFGSMCYSYAPDSHSSAETFKCRREGESLFVDGLIEDVMLDELSIWGTDRFGNKIKKLYLNSKGGIMFDHGSVNATTAVDIIKFIKKAEIETYAGAECKSACVPVFVAGLKRLARASSDFMVHNPRMGGAHLLFLRAKCGENLESPSCSEELEEIKVRQISDMDLYFDLLEGEGVSGNLRKDYLSGAKDPKSPGNGNLVGIENLYFDGSEALGYGVALGLF